MRSSVVSGIIFVALMGVVLGGLGVLDTLRTTAGGVSSPLFGAIGVAWMLAVWSSLVACMIFLITWVAESMSSGAAAQDAPATPEQPAPASAERPRRAAEAQALKAS